MALPRTVCAEGNPYSGGWANCTWSAWELANEAGGYVLPSLGNAGEWYANAEAAGLSVGSEPCANSIGVYSNHVVYVADFDGQNIYLKEGNFNGAYNEEWHDGYTSRHGQALIGYIYLDGYSYSGITYAAHVTDKTEDGKTVRKTVSMAISDGAEEALEKEESMVVLDDALHADLKVDEVDAVKKHTIDRLKGKIAE